MQKILLLIITACLIISCNRFGSGRVKNIIELSSKLEVDAAKQIKFSAAQIKVTDFHLQRKDFLKHVHQVARDDIIAQPVIIKNIIYTIDKQAYVSAYSIKEQKLLWQVNTVTRESGYNSSNGGILYSNGKLYVTNGSRYLVVLDATNGDKIFHKKYPDILKSKPAMAANQLLIAQTASNQLVAYDLKNSKFVWIQEGGAEIISTMDQVAPTIYDDHILASYSSGSVIYLHAEDGSIKWQYNLIESYNVGVAGFEPAVIVTPPIITDDYAYFATSNNKLIKIDLNNGAPVWVKEAEAVQTIGLVGDYLLVTNNARQVSAIDEHDGSTNWVGELISSKEKNHVKILPILTQKPFISKEENQFIINVVASNGELYRFRSYTNGNIATQPEISQIAKAVKYSWFSCCRPGLHLFTGRYLKY